VWKRRVKNIKKQNRRRRQSREDKKRENNKRRLGYNVCERKEDGNTWRIREGR
jgi:mRNA-degrading endonuclease RelE of RelBE toxin-antitoxin system